MVQGSRLAVEVEAFGDRLTVADLEASYRQRRLARFAQREFLATFSTLDRVRFCGRRRIMSSAPVGLALKGDVAHFTNVQTCGSVWADPVCSAKIRFGRAGEVATIAAGHLALGGGEYFVTLTMRHDRSQSLAECIDAVANSFRRLTQNKGGREVLALFGVVGQVRAMEMTYGFANGWHVHLHVLVLVDHASSVKERRLFECALYDVWSAALAGGGFAKPSRRHGVDVVPVTDVEGIALYVMKVEGVSMELTYADRKRGRKGNRAPLQMLDDARLLGDAADLAVWREYETASKGRRMVTYSRGLKRRFGVVSKSDEELASEDVGGELVALIEGGVWAALLRRRGGQAELLDIAETQGKPGVEAFLSRVMEEDG